MAERRQGKKPAAKRATARKTGAKKAAARKPAAKKSAAKPPAQKAAARDAPTRGTAPSSADIESLERFEPSEEAKRSEPSDTDAMGQDKRRTVVGQGYGPSRKSQVIFFAVVGALIVLVVGGSIAAVNAFDQPEDEYPDEAPWSQAEGADNPPPRSPEGPCGEPGNPPQFDPGTACSAVRTADQGPALPGEVPPGGSGTSTGVADQQAGAGGAGGSSGSSGSASSGN